GISRIEVEHGTRPAPPIRRNRTMTERNTDPTLYAVVRADGTAAVTVDGVTQEIRAADEDSVRQQILERARQRAVIAGHPVRLTTSEPAGRWWLIVHA